MGTSNTAVGTTASLTYPHDIEVTVVLKLRVTDAEERNYYLTSDNKITPGLVADTLDGFCGYGNETLLSVNDKTVLDTQAALNGSGTW